MKKNRFDTVLSYAQERADKVRGHIDQEYGKVKPLNTELTPAVDILYTYEKLMLPENQTIVQELIGIHGMPAFLGYRKKALRSKEARGL